MNNMGRTINRADWTLNTDWPHGSRDGLKYLTNIPYLVRGPLNLTLIMPSDANLSESKYTPDFPVWPTNPEK